MEYKWVGSHPQDLASGQMLAPGETAELSDEEVRDPHNETLIADGGLIPVDDKAQHEAKLAQRRAARREHQEGGEEE